MIVACLKGYQETNGYSDTKCEAFVENISNLSKSGSQGTRETAISIIGEIGRQVKDPTQRHSHTNCLQKIRSRRLHRSGDTSSYRSVGSR